MTIDKTTEQKIIDATTEIESEDYFDPSPIANEDRTSEAMLNRLSSLMHCMEAIREIAGLSVSYTLTERDREIANESLTRDNVKTMFMDICDNYFSIRIVIAKDDLVMVVTEFSFQRINDRIKVLSGSVKYNYDNIKFDEDAEIIWPAIGNMVLPVFYE